MSVLPLIVADENIPRVREWFAPLGEVRTLAGRSITAADVAAADILLVRSVTPVDAALLEGSRVAFVGTATIGTDHLDLGWLKRAGIAIASAPGSNAQSVVDYVLGALAAADDVLENLLGGGSAGVIGLGNVGGRLLRRLRALGVDAVGYDPFVTAEDLPQLPFTEVVERDAVCLHVPLTRAGDYPTFHMLGENLLQAMNPGAVLLNGGRGAAVDNLALLRVLKRRPDLRVLLDVWEGEPAIATELLARVQLGTPHIAGYSLDGKLAGTRMLLEACCKFLGESLPQLPSAPPSAAISVTGSGVAGLREALLGVYDPRRDDAALRGWAEDGSMALWFDRLRKAYPVRREIATVPIANGHQLDLETRRLLTAAGFQLD
ncbi:MAG: 4-phosphoerythronate dehydrogenase [Spongiibacteraceae bacterium]